MKKLFLLLIVIVSFALLMGCAVNATTGLIQVTNTSKVAITNVKIGTTTLAFSIPAGGAAQKYYSTAITGKLAVTGVDLDDGVEDITYTFETNWWVNITTYENIDEDVILGVVVVQEQGTMEGVDWDDYAELD
ncbi:MAG: hypothetical protein KAT05_13250 [Spirochaetes bacterium]|nr:hypothetical protein [Spirochaetota bacterium]